MAGQIAELARDTLRRDFRAIDPRDGRVLLVEAADRVLDRPSRRRSRGRPRGRSSDLGVTPLLERTVVGIDAEAVTVETPGRRARSASRRGP